MIEPPATARLSRARHKAETFRISH
jgi:hypothetical protein